ncbi:hypothetical protein UAW_00805 [Enterococcus haemoperoxidus ATCC BAA-382]|uniref:Transcobalamin-like C-terminal domain-containing protein n=1 Tax=Enterococcus haemoperoxidus ATCC BAA-382 TaxID=1158608 RepID=R2QW92_9ENTE|nr:DUF4430 domain-containing protein [Enterococcus haemoperoxidus]EOH99653.1 hypothetical protein UAW_00805 [Enterococcus haemoperoxidus ATCC BAA-382]EOT62607.1 hypothetical protein I583_01608 [Enterococcus haemoperoxidus ATCC BAA-382]
MKKIIKATMVVMVLFLLGACGKATDKKDTTKSSEDLLKVTIILKEDDKEFDKKEVNVKKDESLQTVMETNYKIEMSKDFVSGIDGHLQDAKASKYWMYDVNGKQPDVGAVEYFLKDGDTVTWTLNKL